MATKPTSKLNWVNDGDPAKISEPTLSKKNQGWLAEEKPPFQWFNWISYITWKWLNYYEEKTDETATALGATNTAVGGLSSTVAAQGTAIGNLNTTVGGHTTDIGGLNSAVGALGSAVSGQGTAISAIQGEQTTQNTAIATKLAKPTSGDASGNVIISDGSGGSTSMTKAAFLKAAAAFTAFGDLIYGGSGGDTAKLAGNKTTKRKFLSSIGDGTDTIGLSWEEGEGGLLPESKNADFTAVSGKRYLLDLTAGIVVAMPPGVAGAQVAFFDVNGLAQQAINRATLNPNGTDKWQGDVGGQPVYLDGKYQYINAYWDTANSQWAWESNGVVIAPKATDVQAGTVSYEEDGQHVSNWSGPMAAISRTIEVYRLGKVVTLNFPDIRTTGNNVASLPITMATALPEKWRPKVEMVVPIFVTSGGVDQTIMGYMKINTNGTITIHRDITTPGFSATTSNVGSYAISVSYKTN